MKTKLPFIFFLVLTVTTGYSQKIQIKDGVILKDKEPVAKLEGEATLFKDTHIKIKSLNDELLITIDEKVVDYKSHFQELKRFTKITFIPFNETLYRLDMSQYTSEKKIVGFLYDRIGTDFLTKDGLNKDKIIHFTFDNDHAKEIHEDTTKTGAIVSGYLTGLKQSVQPRNRKASIEFSLISEDKLKWKGYTGKDEYFFDRSFQSIYHDNVLIGVMVKILVKDAVNSPDYSSARYYVLRKIRPFEVGNETFEYAPLALLKTYSPMSLATEIIVENEGMRMAPKINDFRYAEVTLVQTLIQEGLL